MPFFSFWSSLLKFFLMSTSAIHTPTGSHYSSYKWSASASVLWLVVGRSERWDVLYSTPFGADIRPVTLPVVGNFTSRLLVSLSDIQATFCASKPTSVADSALVIYSTFMKMKKAESCASLRGESLDGPLSRWQYKAWEKFDWWYRFRGKCRVDHWLRRFLSRSTFSSTSPTDREK